MQDQLKDLINGGKCHERYFNSQKLYIFTHIFQGIHYDF